MDAHEDTACIQILSVSDTGRRRQWTHDEKVRIVEESRRESVTLAEMAWRYEILRSMLYDWRYRHKLGLLGVPAPFMRPVPMDGVATLRAMNSFAEMRERVELARDAWAEAREEGHGEVSAGLAALRAVAGRKVKELDQDEI